EHLALAPVDRQLRLHDRLRARVVPLFARDFLIVPAVIAGIGVERDDRAQEQVVAASRAPEITAQRRAVAGADEGEVQLRVVRDRVPRRAAAAELPPPPAPGLRRHLHRGVLEAVRGIAGDEIKLPQEAAVVRVVSAHETAYAEVRPAVADDDLAVEHPGRAR